nr:topoisomerase DNA-binding C4 zinc finger domain-containing protein [Alcanivorax sp. 1008]
MSNKAIPGLLKVGMTMGEPVDRASQLSTTGVPAPFIVECQWLCDDELVREHEKSIHDLLDRFREFGNREFFRASVSLVESAISRYFNEDDISINELVMVESARLNGIEAEKSLVRSVRSSIKYSHDSMRQDFLGGVEVEKRNIAGAFSERFPPSAISQSDSFLLKKHIKTRVVSNSGWRLCFSVIRVKDPSFLRGTRKADCLVFSIDLVIKPFWGKESTVPKLVHIAYELKTGSIVSGHDDANFIGNLFSFDFPMTILDVFALSSTPGLSEKWTALFGDAAEIKRVVDQGMPCPACSSGVLVIRHRKRDGRSFYGCDQWPQCSFTYDAGDELILGRGKSGSFLKKPAGRAHAEAVPRASSIIAAKKVQPAKRKASPEKPLNSIRYHSVVSLDGEGEYLVQSVSSCYIFIQTRRGVKKVEAHRCRLIGQ